MRKREFVLTILMIGCMLFGLIAWGNMDGDGDEIIIPTSQVTPVVSQEDTHMTGTVTPEITEPLNTSDITKKLKKLKKPTYIPESLLTFIENSIKKGDQLDSFTSIISNKELNIDEICSFSDNKVVGEYVDMIIASTGTVLQTDADNDGVQDLYFWIKDGGTMGNSSRYLLKGNADGTYMMTDASHIEVTQELAFIDFEGKNYLLQTTFDYNSKINNGFEISLFIDGMVHERIFLSKDAVVYDYNINLKDKSLESIAKSSEKIGLHQYAYHVRYNDYIIQGSAERLLRENEIKDYPTRNSYSLNSQVYYGADTNNDGKEEIYNKDIFFASTLGMITHLQYTIYNTKGTDQIEKCLNGITGTPKMFWVEKSEEGNIVCILSLDNLLDYTIYGYNITKDKVKEVFRVTSTGNMIINRTIYTIGINLDDEKW